MIFEVCTKKKAKPNNFKKFLCVMLSLVLMMSFSSCSSEADVYTPYYDDSNVPGAFKTYINALMNDDYDTYLKITHNSDNETSKRNFNDCKKGYVGMDSVSYSEVKTGSLYGAGASAEYMVAEYKDNGSQAYDYSYTAGRDYSYGLVVVDETKWNSGVYYVSLHYRNFNFNAWLYN